MSIVISLSLVAITSYFHNNLRRSICMHTLLCLRQFTPNPVNVMVMALKVPRVGNAGYSSRYK